MSRLFGVGAAPTHITPGDVKKNLANLARQVASMKFYSPWIQLVCAPELSIQGTANYDTIAESIPGPITEFCCELARKHKIYFIPGTLYERDGDEIFNTAPVINPDGEIIARYRKMYPWRPYETTKSGKETVVFEVPGVGVVGICICYDIWFPELIRDLICKGAEILVIPTLTGSQDRQQELILTQATAITHQCFVISVNGLETGGIGQSLIVDPRGNIMQQTGQFPENMMAMLDLDQVTQVRQYGTCGVSRPLASFFHENHQFSGEAEHREKRLKDSSLRLFRN